MLSTLPLNELEKNTENVYEAIIIIAKRARQINVEQKKLMNTEEDSDANDDYIDEDFEKRNFEYKSDRQRLPKPTTIALEEFLAGKLIYEYPAKNKKES